MTRAPLVQRLVKPHPERDGAFHWRGDGVSRIERLSDAVFGFAITRLVVSRDAPRTFDDLPATVAGFPAFAAAFTLLVLIWAAGLAYGAGWPAAPAAGVGGFAYAPEWPLHTVPGKRLAARRRALRAVSAAPLPSPS